MPKNLIARNYKRFTFDLVLWENFRIELEDRTWKFFSRGPLNHTYRIRLGWIDMTVWVKKKPNEVGAYHDKNTPYLDLE